MLLQRDLVVRENLWRPENRCAFVCGENFLDVGRAMLKIEAPPSAREKYGEERQEILVFLVRC